MQKKDDVFINAWNNRKGPVVFTTVSQEGIANSVYVLSIKIDDNGDFIIADNYFFKTNQNIASGSNGVLLFLTEENKSFQAKGEITCHKTGPYYDFMKKWNPLKHPGHSAVVLHVSELFSGATQLM